VSAAIKASLHKLNSAVSKLEGSLVQVQAKQKAVPAKPAGQPQADLFSASAGPSNMNSLNVRMLANRLDTAINQVEQILKEGRA
jgi:hypothetical protein